MAAEEVDTLLSVLEKEWNSGLEDFEDLQKRVPTTFVFSLEAYLEKGDFQLLLLLSILRLRGDPPSLQLLGRILGKERSRISLEKMCGLMSFWYPAEVLEHSIIMLLSENVDEEKAGVSMFPEAVFNCDGEVIRTLTYAAMKKIREKGDKITIEETHKIMLMFTKAISYSLRNCDFSLISLEFPYVFSLLLDLNPRSSHYLPFLPLFRRFPDLLFEWKSEIQAKMIVDLTSANASERSAAISWLRFFTENEELQWWDAFFDVYQSLENYSRHLVQSIWEKRIQTLFNPAFESWLRLLLTRVRQHENPSVKKHIAKMVMKNRTDFDFRELVLNELVLIVGDSSLFADAPRNAGVSRFGQSVSLFYRIFLSNLPLELQAKSVQIFLSNVCSFVQHQAGFFYSIKSLSGFQQKSEGLVETKTVKNMLEMMKIHFKNLTPAQRREVIKVFGELVEHREKTCELEPLIDLLAAFPMDSLPKNPIFLISDIQEWAEASFSGAKITVPRHICLVLSLTQDFEAFSFPLLMSSPMRHLPVLYSSPYLPLSHIKTAIQFSAAVFLYLETRFSPENQGVFLSFLHSAGPELLSYLLIGSNLDLDHEIWSISADLKTVLKCVMRTSGESEEMEIVGKIGNRVISAIAETRFIEIPGLMRLFYWTLAASRRSIRISSIVYSTFESILSLHPSEIGGFSNHENALKMIVLKWKIFRVCFNQDTYLLVQEDIPRLLDISSSAMQSTAFRILELSLGTDFEEGKRSDFEGNLRSAMWTGLGIVKDCRLDLSVKLLNAFYGFALNPALFRNPEFIETLQNLIMDILEIGKDRWQYVRGAANHLLFSLQQNLDLIPFFLPQILALSMYQELRGPDSDLCYPDPYEVLGIKKPDFLFPKASECGHMTQLVTLGFLDSIGDRLGTSVEGLVVLAGKVFDEKEMRKVDMPNSSIHIQKICIGQLLLTLAPYFPYSDSGFVTKTVNRWLEILQTQVSTLVRFYLEKLCVFLALKNLPAVAPLLLNCIKDPRIKVQFCTSVIYIAGAVWIYSKKASEFAKEITPFLISNIAQLRRTAHFIVMKYIEVNPGVVDLGKEFSWLITFLTNNSDCVKMRCSLEKEFLDFEDIAKCGLEVVLTASFNEFGALVPNPVLDRIDSITAELMSETRLEDFSLRVDEFWLLEASHYSLPSASSNYQRKPTQTSALEFSHKGEHKRHEIVILASFITSPFTLAGLTRTCEVFSVKSLLYSQGSLLESMEFKQMSVTAEKWMPMVKVGEMDVAGLLKRYKEKGYTVIGLAYTVGKTRDVPRIPKLTVLIPVDTKSELPPEISQEIDLNLSLPLGSPDLNPHLEASLWIWEYTKQNFLLPSESSIQ